MATKKTKKETIAAGVWRGSHRYGCKCDGNHLTSGSREGVAPYSDGSVGACEPEKPCPTASVEWNGVRAAFAQASALRPTIKIALALEALVAAPLVTSSLDSLAAIADALRETSEQ